MSILSKNRMKYIRSLELKKIRKEEKVFLAEGPKLVGDVLGYFPCKLLIATSDWLEEHPAVQDNTSHNGRNCQSKSVLYSFTGLDAFVRECTCIWYSFRWGKYV